VDPAQFFRACRLVIVAGKGGVGKTTVSAALARAAANTGEVPAIPAPSPPAPAPALSPA